MSIEIIGPANHPAAIIVRSSAKFADGVQFLTPLESPMQLGIMMRPKNYNVAPHIHNTNQRLVEKTFEFIFVRNGKCVVNLFDEGKNVSHSITLETGDSILLGDCAHGIEMLTDCELIEVKQGPYVQKEDKTLLT